MNKTEAADYLRVSIRTMQRLMSAGKVEFKTGTSESGVKAAVFERAALDRYKAAAAAAVVSPSVSPASETGIVAGLSARPREASLGRFAELRELAAVLRPAPAPSLADLAVKFALTVAEASELTGYGRGVIEAALRKGLLKSSTKGRRGARVIKRSDLEAWVKRL